MRRPSAAYLLVVGLLAGVLLMALLAPDHTPVGVSGAGGGSPTAPAEAAP